MFTQSAVITDCLFWSSVQGRFRAHIEANPYEEIDKEDERVAEVDWANQIDDTFDHYAIGQIPPYSRSWDGIDYVYVPVNSLDQHWVAAMVDIPNRHITLFDPNISMTRAWFQCKNAKCLAVLFPYILARVGYYARRPELANNDGTPNLQRFTISRMEDPSLPQQTVCGDCGVFVCKFIEYLFAGRSFDFNAGHVPYFRQRYAVDIFHEQ